MRYVLFGCLMAFLMIGCAVATSALLPYGGPPEDQLEAPQQVRISGLGCENGYGADLNQDYAYRGTTKDGRPYYQGTTRDDRYLYFDRRCADDTDTPRWILGGKPSLDRTWDLNPNDGDGCENDFSVNALQWYLPTGSYEATWVWCGDHGLLREKVVTVSAR